MNDSDSGSDSDSDSGSGSDTGRPSQNEESFCSRGCRDVAAALGSPVDVAGSAVESDTETKLNTDAAVDADTPPQTQTETETTPDSSTRNFFRIDGMHAALCESYLEYVAESTPGVHEATASYVTETVRVDHDPDRISAAELESILTRTGYTAYRREEATGRTKETATTRSQSAPDAESATSAAAESTGGTQRSREMTGIRKRRADDMLEIRYIVGIVFGSFLLVPYVAVLYPTYLAGVVDWGFLALYEEAFQRFDGTLILPLFFTVTGAVLYLAGMPLLRGAYISLRRRRASTHLLATLTVGAAFCYGTLTILAGRNDIYYDLTVLVAALVMAAFFAEAMVKRQAMSRLTDLTISQVSTARLYDPGQVGQGHETSAPPEDDDATDTRSVPVEALSPGDRVLVRAGERIPVDGTLTTGTCRVDEAVVTGESLPVTKTAGEVVVGGSVVLDNAAVVAVGEHPTSSIDRLTHVVWNLQSATHGLQRRADDLAALALPLVLVAAGAAAVFTIAQGGDYTTATLATFLAILVASPWALGFATPCSVAASIREAMTHGIIVFDETVFERLRSIDVVVFDKTGTLTTGEMSVIEADAPADLLQAAGELEYRAAHPAAKAISDAFAGSEPVRTDGGTASPNADDAEGSATTGSETTTDDSAVEHIDEFTAHDRGVSGFVDGNRVLVGHPDLFAARGWDCPESLENRAASARSAGRLPVLVGRDGSAEGIIVIGDEARTEWEETITALAANGIEVVVLTGDEGNAASSFAAHADVSHVFAGVSPDGKTAAIRRLCEENRVAMVGDGTNDAPALAACDLGISLGSGTALAADAADLAIVDDDLAGVERAFALARAARRRVYQNLVLAFGYNALVLPLAVAGVLNPLFTTIGVVGTAGLIAANSWRSLLSP
ncbi:ATPase P [Natrialba magadii ATCC 43099]|uniref:ATPase P n=1 Tax=Natrialba magadii (strain ATCC 43099 / DSM 3394 / CCM 3739 / CIP 104546 / IAM 13178 / JCM 8861 / NBRC 102185 / NCIMB 2190 / MS3) TaxID=547559 RepID=L9UH59_NATMM|nr:ATPase P [Natrialba magadii ATCC 43099]